MHVSQVFHFLFLVCTVRLCYFFFLLNNCVNNLILFNKRIQIQTYFLNNKKMICILTFRLLSSNKTLLFRIDL